MKHLKWIPFVLAALILMSCSFTSALGNRQGGNEAQEDPTALPAQPNASGQESQPEASTQEDAPAEAGAPGGSHFHDAFDAAGADWSDTLTVTTQATGGKSGSSVTTEAGKLTFQFQAKETYAYKFLQSDFPDGIVIETQFKALDHITNGIAIVCHANDDQSEWLEVRLSSRSKYNIYHYDKSRKANGGRNPYVQIAQGGLDLKTLYPMEDNLVRVTCSGSVIALEINGAAVTTFDRAPILKGRKAGLGAMSSDVLPLGVQFDYLDVSQP